jgi:serine/threonine-protein kinase
MPREQLTQYKYVRPASDLWSMAATFYFALTGSVPIDFPDEKKAIQAILHSDAVPIRRRDVSIPQPLAAIIDRALATSPENRFASAGEMRNALAAALA